MIKTKRIELAIGDARRRLNERSSEVAKKYDQGAQRLRRESNERETRQAAERLRAESNERDRERRRRLNERADQALADYTRYFKAAQAPIIPFDLFEEAEEKFYLGSLDEDYEQETVSEMQRSWFGARDSLSAQQPGTRTIETQTDLSFLSY